MRLRLDASGDRVEALEVLETANPAWRVPTTGTVVGDALLYIGTSHVDGISPAGPHARGGPRATSIFRLELPR